MSEDLSFVFPTPIAFHLAQYSNKILTKLSFSLISIFFSEHSILIAIEEAHVKKDIKLYANSLFGIILYNIKIKTYTIIYKSLCKKIILFYILQHIVRF